MVRGHGMVRALRTGRATRIGQIGKLLATIGDEPTLLQRTSARLIARLGLLAFGFCLCVFLVYGLLRGDWIGGALAGITLAIALPPRSFRWSSPSSSRWAWRLAGQKVLVDPAAIIETWAPPLCSVLTRPDADREPHDRGRALGGRGAAYSSHLAGAGPATRLIGTAELASAIRPIDPMDTAVRQSRSRCRT